MTIDNTRYEVTVIEDPDNGDLIIPLPPQILNALKAKAGDELSVTVDNDGKLYFRKI